MEKIPASVGQTKYINDPATHADAVKIMANRSGVDPKQYELMVSGTHLLSIADNKSLYQRRWLRLNLWFVLPCQ